MSIDYFQDTIMAQATPVGEGAIGIIRLSGPDSKKILGTIFRGKTQVHDFESHKLYLGRIVRGQVKGEGEEEILDQVMVVWMKAPQTFTGEEMVEIDTHGGPLILSSILNLIQKNGGRLAEPGEFSKRAFLNGKIDLSQAEAIADLIHADNEWALKNSLKQLDGYLSRLIGGLRQRLIEILSRVELGFDFAEEDVQLFKKEEILFALEEIQKQVEALLDSFQTGKLYKEGIRVALVGRPNVGKSSLLNALLREDRAIIHEEPGTTRDVIEGERKINGILVRFYDTAGIHEANHPVEQEGIRRSEKIFAEADLGCLLLDSSEVLTSEDYHLIAMARQKKALIVCSKGDLPPKWEPDHQLRSQFVVVSVSSKTNEGIESLLKTIFDVSVGANLVKEHNFVLNNVRYYGQLEKALLTLKEVRQNLSLNSLSDECLAEELRIIIMELGEITGEITSEDVLNEIFSKFCIGK